MSNQVTRAPAQRARAHPRDGVGPGRRARRPSRDGGRHRGRQRRLAPARLPPLREPRRTARGDDPPPRRRERLSQAPRRDARSGARRGLRGRCCDCGWATCPRSSTWPARSRPRSSPATRAARPGATAWTTSTRPSASPSRGSTEAGRLAPGWTVDTAADWVYARSHVSTWQHLVVDRGWPAARLRRAHDRLDHGRGRRPGAGRMTIGPRSIPASALSPRRRRCPLDPGPIAYPRRLGQGLPGSSGRAFGRSSQEETVGW